MLLLFIWGMKPTMGQYIPWLCVSKGGYTFLGFFLEGNKEISHLHEKLWLFVLAFRDCSESFSLTSSDEIHDGMNLELYYH